MRRAEITEGIYRIFDALVNSNLVMILEMLVSMPTSKIDKGFYAEFLNGVKKYIIFAQAYNATDRELSKILGLDLLEDPVNWASINDEQGRNKLYELHSNVRFASSYLPKLISIIERGALHNVEEKIKAGLPQYKDMRILSINIYEDENTFSSPLRIVDAIESVNHFYYACAMLDNKSPSTISLVACDSGSDKSFDFLGLAQVMECVERILEKIWERVFFYREHQFEERLDLVAKSLPIVAQIAKMKEHNEIAPELAEQLEQNILNGTNKFIQSGASTKQIENTSHYSPRALLTPVQRLLVSAPESETETKEDAAERDTTHSESAVDTQPESSKSGKMNFGNLSPEEQDVLRQLYEKATSGNSPATTEGD